MKNLDIKSFNPGLIHSIIVVLQRKLHFYTEILKHRESQSYHDVHAGIRDNNNNEVTKNMCLFFIYR